MRSKRKIVREFTENFLAGGFLVAIALWIAYTSSPVIGGLIAGLPLRFAVTWILGAVRKGPEFAQMMARGSLRGMTANIISSLTLFYSLFVLGFAAAFALTLVVCFVIILVLRFTFPE